MKKLKDMKKQNNTETVELKNQLARALADYANLKKRSEEERSQMYKLASISFIIKLLPILDSLREAQKHLDDSGIAIIVGQIEAILKEDGFIEIRPQDGEKFDENIHEAIDTLETNQKERDNIISSIILTGWKFGEEVVRYAKVKVFKYLKKESEENK